MRIGGMKMMLRKGVAWAALLLALLVALSTLPVAILLGIWMVIAVHT